ncbi:MAG: hypothetical protein J6Y78_04370 [Paludibacteraceae bacterium]|nr:hypothetical protein [Paludibacteraceae bacterium]
MDSFFDLIRVDSFMDDINREDCFDTRDMDGITPNYKFVLASDCPANINDCIDEDGTLTDAVTLIDTAGVDDGFCSMMWTKGINGERTMSVADSTVSYDFGENTVDLKAVFLINIADGTGYVIAYSIQDKPVQLDGSLIMPCDGVVWSFRYGD